MCALIDSSSEHASIDFKPPQWSLESEIRRTCVPTQVLGVLRRSHAPSQASRYHEHILPALVWYALRRVCIHYSDGAPDDPLAGNLSLRRRFHSRTAGCTWNDVIDRDLDCLVERTRLQPMARGAVGLQAACVFTVAQFFAWLALLW